ncbi:hypothetical protein HYN48_06285 [Flavobacterium magnum]|uniref:Globin n=1 Tax=Flavobacterium magnum TaxID=2162713 RepID=A0A2S0REJ7_9FLAO|nr:group III truncated hemoglobin [Flavobacterium magnum]AWA29720.1 hypothetical protein HYN48_06285 [Flavobacterium magnum]
MRDIETRADIEQLMGLFYQALLEDPAISYIFTEVARVNLERHLPVIVDFWQQILVQTRHYQNNVFEIHKMLHGKSALTKVHFAIWLSHLNYVVDRHFLGPNAEKIKTSALSIATIMQLKLL